MVVAGLCAQLGGLLQASLGLVVSGLLHCWGYSSKVF